MSTNVTGKASLFSTEGEKGLKFLHFSVKLNCYIFARVLMSFLANSGLNVSSVD